MTNVIGTWGGVALPAKVATNSFLVLGAPGGGKSITISMLLADVHHSAERILLFDPKLEFLSLLRKHLGYRDSDLTVIHPFVEGAHCWDLAADFTDDSSRKSLAAACVPHETGGHNRHFSASAQIWVENIAKVLHEKRTGLWTFRDLVIACNSHAALEEVMKLDPELAAQELESFSEAGKEGRSVLNTLKMQMRAFDSVVTAWQKSWDQGRRFSLTKWVRGEGPRIVVLGYDENHGNALTPAYKAFFERASQLLLSSSEPLHDHAPRTWLFLDELHYLSPGKELVKLLTAGRSPGISVVAGQQFLETLYPDERGVDRAAALFAGIKNRLYVSPARSHITAKFMSDTLGDQNYIAESYGNQEGGRGNYPLLGSESYQERNSPAVSPGEFQNLRTPSEGDFFEAYASAAELGVWLAQIPSSVWPPQFKNAFQEGLLELAVQEPSRLLWSTEDRQRLFGAAPTIRSGDTRVAAPAKPIRQLDAWGRHF